MNAKWNMNAIFLPEWMISERYLTLATWGLVLCTFLLVIATVILWVDSWNKGNEQRERWSREDAGALLAAEPRYRFGLRFSETSNLGKSSSVYAEKYQVMLWVANLGLTGLYVETLSLKHRDHASGTIEVNRVISAGQELDFDLPCEFWETVPASRTSDGNYIYGDHEVWLSLEDHQSSFETGKILYTILYMQGKFQELRRGSHEERQPTCPKCHKLLSFLMPKTGLLTEDEVQNDQWKLVLTDLNSSCPNHASKRLNAINTPEWFTKMTSSSLLSELSKKEEGKNA